MIDEKKFKKIKRNMAIRRAICKTSKQLNDPRFSIYWLVISMMVIISLMIFQDKSLPFVLGIVAGILLFWLFIVPCILFFRFREDVEFEDE